MQDKFRIIPTFPASISSWKTAQRMRTGIADITPCLFLVSEDEGLLMEAVQEAVQELITRKAVCANTLTPCISLNPRRQRNFAEEFQRMYITLKNHAGFCNEYRGIVAVNLSDWASGQPDEDLEAVLSYLKDTQKDRYYVFYAVSANPGALQNVLQLYFPTEIHALCLGSKEDILPFAISQLNNNYNVVVDDQANPAMLQIIETVMNSGSYRGIVSIQRICRDMAFILFSTGQHILTAAFLSEYKESFLQKETKRKKPAVGLIK